MEKHTKILAYILAASLIVKLSLLPLFLDATKNNLPYFDMHLYILEGRCILEGKVLYSGNLNELCVSAHGPSFSLIMALALKILGESFLLKLPAIFFESLSIFVFFSISKMVSNIKTSLFFTFAYAFSYIPLYLTGMTGNDEPMFMFFTLLATFFLLRDKPLSSALFLAIAASFKITPFLFLPAFVIAVYSSKGVRKTLTFAFVFAVTLSLIFLPFYLKAGERMFIFYAGTVTSSITNTLTPDYLSVLNLVRLSERVVSYAIAGGVSNQDRFMEIMNKSIVPILSLSGLLFSGSYILFNRLKKRHLEFIRNCIIVVISALLTAPVVTIDYLFWFMPFLFLFLSMIYPKNYASKQIILKKEYLGAVLTLVGVFMSAAFFKFSWDTIYLSTYLLWVGIVSSVLGAYFIFTRLPKRERLIWSALVLVASMQVVIGANPLLVAKPLAEKILPASLVGREVVVASEAGGIVRSSFLDDLLYLPYTFTAILLFITGAFSLGWRVHKLGNKYGGVKKWNLKREVQKLKKRKL